MAALNLPAANAVAMPFPNAPGVRCRNWKCLVAVQAGQAIYRDPTTGRAGLCNTATAGKQQFRGIALESGAAGSTISVLEHGELAGFDLSGLSYDDLVYAQDADGAIGTSAGTKSVPIGRVAALTDRAGSKMLLISSSTTSNY